MNGASDGGSTGPESAHTRSILLVGFMAAGKSAVGAWVAEQLGWRLVDVDSVIERRQGRTIAEIFAQDGEPHFRLLEAEAVAEALDLPGAVVVPGGGWASSTGGLRDLPSGVLSVWLQVGAREAVRRARSQGVDRPLLDRAEDPESTARDLLESREPDYRLAALHLDTEGRTPLELADQIIDHLV